MSHHSGQIEPQCVLPWEGPVKDADDVNLPERRYPNRLALLALDKGRICPQNLLLVSRAL